MIPIEKLKVFYYVSKTGGTLQASKALNVTQPAISKQVTLLEKSIGVKLFTRTHRGLSLTKQGYILLESTEMIFKELNAAEDLIKNENDEPSGLLRITTTWDFVNSYLTQLIPKFAKKYPKIHLSVSGTDSEEEFNFSKADVLIRPFKSKESNVQYHQLMLFRFHLYAHKKYIERFGTPQNLQDLDRHRLLAYDAHVPHPFSSANWHLTAGTNEIRSPFVSVNSSYAAYKMAKRGMGIISLSPSFPAVQKERLIPILENECGPEVDISLSYPNSLSHSKKVLAFSEFIKENINNFDFDEE